jgi:hypothetical protein
MKTSLPEVRWRSVTDAEAAEEMRKPDALVVEAMQTEMRMKGRAAAEGAKRSGDSSRDNWRTPKWLMDVLHAEFQYLWDATGHGSDEWAHGCGSGCKGDSHKVTWPTHYPVFCNPPFSEMKAWAPRIAEHPGTIVTVCKLAPSTKWWQTLTSLDSHFASSLGTRWTNTPKGKISRIGFRDGVDLWLLPVRVAYEPPPGIAASSPSFDSCVVVRL